jgi:hypothetical protein
LAVCDDPAVTLAGKACVTARVKSWPATAVAKISETVIEWESELEVAVTVMGYVPVPVVALVEIVMTTA